MTRPISAEHFAAIFAPRDPAASLRASADAFDAMGRNLSADVSRYFADSADRLAPIFGREFYRDLAAEQAERAARLSKQEQAA